jgi:hypothetical protein
MAGHFVEHARTDQFFTIFIANHTPKGELKIDHRSQSKTRASSFGALI